MQKKVKEVKGKAKILFFDIETMANQAYVWGKYEQNVIAYKQHWYMLSFAWKWLGESKTNVLGLDDFSGYKKGSPDDKKLVTELWKLFDEADVVIAHNGADFDVKKANSRFAKYGMPPPSPYKIVDTKLIARKYLKQDSNKLDDLGDYFNIGRKINTGGFELWLGCESGDKNSWKLMKDYNIQDVILLEEVYLHLLPWMTNHPNMNLLLGTTHNCPNCGAKDLEKRGFNHTRTTISQRYQCKSCHSWSSGEKIVR